jgi:glycosyltransferase involved in cell wall biosynthesis
MKVLGTTRRYRAHHDAFCQDQARALAALGNDVYVFACDGADDDLTLDGQASSVERVRVVAPRRASPGARVRVLAVALVKAVVRRPIRLWLLVWRTSRRHGLRREFVKSLEAATPVLAARADVVHIGWLDLAVRCVDVLPLIRGAKVVTCHGSDVRVTPLGGASQRAVIQRVFEETNLVHCVSDDLRAHALELGLDPAKAFVGQWGVDTSFFSPEQSGGVPHPSSDDRKTLRVVSVGRLHWVKGYEYALQALAQVREAGIEVSYEVLGEDCGALLSMLTAVRDFGLEEQVIIRGECPDHVVVQALRAADVFVLSSVSEGLSTATLEAMAVGVPVVVTDVGGMRDAVTDGVEGFVVPARDPAGLASALLELAADPLRRQQMGAQGRKRVDADFDVSMLARALHEQYQRLVDA